MIQRARHNPDRGINTYLEPTPRVLTNGGGEGVTMRAYLKAVAITAGLLGV